MASSTHLHSQPELSPRQRILAASKHLFSVLGYENTGLEAIRREAAVSDGEFTESFSAKEELLHAIFEEAWSRVVLRLTRLQTVGSPVSHLKAAVREIFESLDHDPKTREMIVLEGRRVHQGEMMLMTASYTDLVALTDSLVERSLPEGATPEKIHLIRSALMGAVDGLLRDVVMRERFGFPAEFSLSAMEQFTSDLVEKLVAKS